MLATYIPVITMQPNEPISVVIEDIEPYSVLHTTDQERQLILDTLDDQIEQISASESFGERWLTLLTELRETVAESSSALRLDVGEHDRLCSVLHGADTGEFLVRRLDESAPGCDLCDKRGYVQIRVDGSEPWTICTDYKAALVSTDDYRLLQCIDSEITSETDVIIEWPTKNTEDPPSQVTLERYD